MEPVKRQVIHSTVCNNSESRRKEKLSPGTHNFEFKFKKQGVLHPLNVFFFPFAAVFTLP